MSDYPIGLSMACKQCDRWAEHRYYSLNLNRDSTVRFCKREKKICFKHRYLETLAYSNQYRSRVKLNIVCSVYCATMTSYFILDKFPLQKYLSRLKAILIIFFFLLSMLIKFLFMWFASLLSIKKKWGFLESMDFFFSYNS